MFCGASTAGKLTNLAVLRKDNSAAGARRLTSSQAAALKGKMVQGHRMPAVAVIGNERREDATAARQTAGRCGQ